MNADDYLRVNSKNSKPFLFGINGRGFYSEINNLLNAMLFGMVEKRRICVDQSRFSYGSIKWSDIFTTNLPSSFECDTRAVASSWKVYNHKSPGFSIISERINLWHRKRRFFASRSYGFYRNVFQAKRTLAMAFCKPRADGPPPPPLAPYPYVAIHVRRGDKIDGFRAGRRLAAEGENVPVEKYLSIIDERLPKIKNLFVMTDDYRVIEEIQSARPGLKIYTFCDKGDQGYIQQSFDACESSLKVKALRRIVSEAEIARRSRIFIGCYKSNVSRYIALVHERPGQCLSADGCLEWHPL